MRDPASYQIAVSVEETVPNQVVEDLVDALETAAFDFHVERRPVMAMAANQWLIPTAIVLFFSRKLFDAFLSEAGKDLYAYLKTTFVRLVNRTAGGEAGIELRLLVSSQTPYKVTSRSGAIVPVLVPLPDKTRAVFHFSTDLSQDLHEIAVVELLELLRRHYAGETFESLGLAQGHSVVRSGSRPFVYDGKTGVWRAMNNEELYGNS